MYSNIKRNRLIDKIEIPDYVFEDSKKENRKWLIRILYFLTFLEELKVQYNGSNLNKYISIFYNDWSLNPYDEDDYSERVSIKGDVLKNINSKEFQNYEVLWYDPYVFDPNFIEICVKEIKWKMKDKIQETLENMDFFETKEVKEDE